jgi:leader peptidase (prepilin peptidase)/N-methyltransferase
MDPSPVDALWFRFMLGLVIGLILGSFTTMLSYRIPRRLSIIMPPSQCPNCHTPLKPRDLVPVLSWILEKGHCRHCREPISPRYLIIELVTTAAVLTAFLTLGLTPPVIPALFGIVAFVTLVTINVERRNEG